MQEETVPYLGKTYSLKVTIEQTIEKGFVSEEENYLHMFAKEEKQEELNKIMRRFYYQQSKMVVQKRIRYFQARFKSKPHSLTIANDITVWGTCNARHDLTFYWKISMLPIELIDYIVVHELCHMTHLNHDRSFWRLVGSILPDYMERKERLEQLIWK